MEDVNEAIALERNALALRPPEHPERSPSLSDLGTYLSSRYGNLGKLGDLIEALSLDRAALILRPPGHQD